VTVLFTQSYNYNIFLKVSPPSSLPFFSPFDWVCYVVEKNERRLAEGLTGMGMYAIGVESSAEVLVYINRALEICSNIGLENG